MQQGPGEGEEGEVADSECWRWRHSDGVGGSARGSPSTKHDVCLVAQAFPTAHYKKLVR